MGKNKKHSKGTTKHHKSPSEQNPMSPEINAAGGA